MINGRHTDLHTYVTSMCAGKADKELKKHVNLFKKYILVFIRNYKFDSHVILRFV